MQYFKYAAGEVAARQQAQHKSEQTKRLIDARAARFKRIADQQAAEEQVRLAAKAARSHQFSTDSDTSTILGSRLAQQSDVEAH